MQVVDYVKELQVDVERVYDRASIVRSTIEEVDDMLEEDIDE